MLQRQILSAGIQGIFSYGDHRPGSAAGTLFLRPLAFICLLLFLSASPLQALNVPPLTARVMDTAGVLPSATISGLEIGLERLEAETGARIAVLIIPTLGGENLEEYSARVSETWNLGQAGKADGALLLVAVEDQMMRIQAGHGLEDRLTDLMARRIFRDRIVPAFRKSGWDGGVQAGVEAMISVARGEDPFSETAVIHTSDASEIAATHNSDIQALDVPLLTARVMDMAGVLSSATISALEADLERLEVENGAQIAVLIIPTLGGENLEEYSRRVAETWQLGQVGKADGALLFIAIKEGMLRIEVGHGLADRLPNRVLGRIMTERINPAFGKDGFDGGVSAGVKAMVSIARGENPFSETAL